jgi:hypothetical protein
MGFRPPVSEDALVASGRCCCLCHTFCGPHIELHHIKQKADGGEDTFENCIPLCYNCHGEVKAYNPNHPKGRKYTEGELIRHRDNWYEKVANGFTKPILSEPSKLDVDLFNEIKNMFDNRNLEYYLSEYDLGGDFDNTIFSNLNEFYYSCSRPEFEFIDEELEKLKGNLYQSVNDFLSFKAINTFSTNIGTQAIRSWHDKDIYDDEDNKLVKQFNDLASDLWDKYKVLVKECRKKFAYIN